MNNLFIFSIIIISVILTYILYKEKWKLRHIGFFVIAIIFTTTLAIYGKDILIPFWSSINAADFWLVLFLIVYGGGFFISILPIIFSKKNNKLKRTIRLFKIWFIIGLLGAILDNTFYGPYSLGSKSAYINESLCTLDPTYASIDIFLGCNLQRLGINPFTDVVAVISYLWLFFIFVLIIGWDYGWRYLEKKIYEV